MIDYRALTNVTKKFVLKLNGAQYFSTLTFWAGYHHIFLDNDSITKTAFTLPFRKYEYMKVPFRLAHVPVYFQELMNKVLKDLSLGTAYLCDIIIYSKTGEEYLDLLQQVFHKICNAKLPIKLGRCHFFAKEIQYLGQVLSTAGMKPLPSKNRSNYAHVTKRMPNKYELSLVL